MHSIPPKSYIEKLWIIFQLLCGMCQMHAEGRCHGDISPENILMTSNNWVLFSDIVPWKPTFVQESDHKTFNLFFGENDNNKRCYIAPERFTLED